MSFRLQAKHVFLTYPQAAAINSKEDLMEFLKQRRDGYTYCIVSKELHSDEGTHYHCLVSYNKKLDIRDATYWDFQGHHPNIQSARNPFSVIQYIKKDGDFIETGGLALTTIHAKCESLSRGQWEEYCIENNISFAYCESIWRRTHPRAGNTIERPLTTGTGTMCTALQQFKWDNWGTPLVLVGPTGCGKTIWAINNSPKPALFVSHIDRLRDFDNEIHKSIIFDDMVFKHFPVQAQIHLVDSHMPRDIHLRYTIAHIPPNTSKIFTCNERPFDDHPAVNRRIRLFSINI